MEYILAICGIAVAGFICNWVAWRVQVPAILFLLFTGIVAGPVLGWLSPDQLFGELLTPIVSVGVAIVLFEGSLTLKFSEIRGHGSVVRNLVTIGVAITWVSAALAAHYVMGWDPLLAALFGAVVTVSGPTVVMPLLRAVRLQSKVASILRWESILVDPLGAILALLVFDVILATQTDTDLVHVAATVGTLLFIGTLIGASLGYLYGYSIRRRWIPDFLRDYSAVAAVLLAFSLAEYVQAEAGFLAVTIMGIWLANMRDLQLDDILSFKESITLLLIGGLFILLAGRLDIEALSAISVGGVIILVLLQLLAGPARALASGFGGDMRLRELLYIGWVFPRGIVAAAVSSLFAIKLSDIGYPGADALVPLVFIIIIGTVVLQSISAKPMARLLGVSEPDPTGVLIVGSNLLGRTIAKAIQDTGLSVRVADRHYAGIRAARMSGLPVYYGSPVSTYAEEHLSTAGIGNLLAVSRQPGLSELACVRYARDFGRDHVYVISTTREKAHSKHSVSGEVQGRMLFGGEIKIDQLITAIKGGGAMKKTVLSEEYGLEEYQEKNPESLIIFAVDENERLHFPVSDADFAPLAGWTIMALSGVERKESNDESK